MQPLQVQVELDHEAIKLLVEKQIAEITQQKLILMDAERFMNLFSMNKRFFEQWVASDPRVQQYERRRDRKRFWLYEPTVKAVLEIIENEW